MSSAAEGAPLELTDPATAFAAIAKGPVLDLSDIPQIISDLREAFDPVWREIGEIVRESLSTLVQLAELDASPPATRGAVSPKVPAYRDRRPRWQSPYGPARRR